MAIEVRVKEPLNILEIHFINFYISPHVLNNETHIIKSKYYREKEKIIYHKLNQLGRWCNWTFPLQKHPTYSILIYSRTCQLSLQQTHNFELYSHASNPSMPTFRRSVFCSKLKINGVGNFKWYKEGGIYFFLEWFIYRMNFWVCSTSFIREEYVVVTISFLLILLFNL